MNNSFKTCNVCGSFSIPYSNNASWEIKWNPRDNAFVLFLYVREINGIRVYAEPMPHYILITISSDAGEAEKWAKWCVSRLTSFYNIKLQ